MPLSTYMTMPVTAPAIGDSKKAPTEPTSSASKSLVSGPFSLQ